jgi:transcriptional regulator with XRE-family HTH domain
MAEPMIGERIRALRKFSSYTQDDLAAAAEISVDVIRKLEQGRRHTASSGTLHRIARALDVDIAELLGRPRTALAASDNQEQVGAIRDALTSVDDLLGELDGADAPDLTEFSRAVSYAWSTFFAGKYGPLVALLPRLLADAQAVAHAVTTVDLGCAADLAAQVHQSPQAPWFGSMRLTSVMLRPVRRCAWPLSRWTRYGLRPRTTSLAMC